MTDNVSMNWQVNEWHYREQTVAEWARMLPDAAIDPNGTPDECAEAINGWLENEVSADEVLIDLATEATWASSEGDRDRAEAEVVPEERS